MPSPSPPRPVLCVGCPMWAHPAWAGRYLTGVKGRELAEYAAWCNAVEGNTTFYAVPAPATVARWADLAPGDFRFAFKAPRTVTHDRRLHPSAHRELASFLRAIDPLGERVGPVQLQLPPSFGPESLDRLRSFVNGLPTSHRWVVELRHAAFCDGGPAHVAADAALHAAGVGRVVLDTRPLYAVEPQTDAAVDERRTKPRLPVAVDGVGDEPVVRVIGADDEDVTRGGLSAWIDPVVDWLAQGRRPYVFTHQPDNRISPELARWFHAQVAARVADLVPLPEPTPMPGPGDTGQASLL